MKNRCEMCEHYAISDEWCDYHDRSIEPHRVCEDFKLWIKIKQLSWEVSSGGDIYSATIGHEYRYIILIRSLSDINIKYHLKVMNSPINGIDYQSFEEAKSAAQAHFEQMVLSYLE